MAKQHGEFESVKTAILSTAALLFTQRGIHSTSLADISAEAKLSKGTLYYYYQSKEQLISDVTDDHIGRITDAVLIWIDSLNRDCDPADAIRAFLDALRSAEGLLKLHIVLTGEAALGNTVLQKKFAAKYREWTVMLEVGTLKMKPPAAERLRTYSKAFVAMLDGFALHSQIGIEDPDLETMLRFLAE